ncbi:MAG: GerMN domain-containing protein [Clostridium sp.]
MKKRIITTLLMLTLISIIFVSCGKQDSKITDKTPTEKPQVQSEIILRDYFPYAQGVELTYTSSNNKKTKVKVSSTQNNSIILSHGKESTIEFTNEGLMLNDDFILKHPIQNNSSWDTSNGKATIKNIQYVLQTPIGNITCIEVSIDSDINTTYYFAKNFGIIKIKTTNKDKTEEYYLTNILGSNGFNNTSNPSDESTSTNVTKIYYYDGDKDAVVYTPEVKDLLAKDATKFFENKFKMPPNSLSPLMPTSTKINSIKVDKKTSTVTMDVSEVFTESMNLGTSSESGILQGIANTLGDAYSCKKVLITENGKDFVTGHSIIDIDNPLITNTSNSNKL